MESQLQQENLQFIGDLEKKLKVEKSLYLELESKFMIIQDENEQLTQEQAQLQAKCVKYNDEILLLRQELQDKELIIDEEKECKKNLEDSLTKLNVLYESDKQIFVEITNQKKELNETVINLEKQV